MPCRDALGAERERMIEEGIELDLAVAQDIRVRCAAGLIVVQEIGKHALAVFAGEVHRLDLDTDHVGDRGGVDQVLPRRAVLVGVVVLPVLHEDADDLVTLALEEPRRNRRVHAAGQADDDTLFALHDGITRMNYGRAKGGVVAQCRQNAKGRVSPCPCVNARIASGYCPGPAFLVVSLSASCFAFASGNAFGAPLVASTDFVRASAFCGPLGILPTFSICVSSFTFCLLLAFFAALFSSGVICALAAFAASRSAFILACSSGVVLVTVLSSAMAALEPRANVPAINAASSLFIYAPVDKCKGRDEPLPPGRSSV